MKDGKGIVKKFYKDKYLNNEGEYLNGEKMEKEKNILKKIE